MTGEAGAAPITGTAIKRMKHRITGSTRVWAFNACLGLGAAALYFFLVGKMEPIAIAPIKFPMWGVAILFFLGETLVVHLQFRRDAYTYSLAEIALVLALFFAAPSDLVIGQFIGSFIALAVGRRQSLIKAVFNVSHYCFEAGVAAILFHWLIDSSAPTGPMGWLVVVVCTTMVASVGTAMVAIAISLSGGNLKIRTVLQGLGYGYVVMLTNTSLALLAVEILWRDPAASWLLAVPTGLLFVSYRAYIGQREKREGIELLYESSRTVQRSHSSEQAVLTLLKQAREMFRAETAQLTLFSEEEEQVGLRTVVGPGDHVAIMEHVEMNPKEGVWARVASEGQAVLIPRPIQNDRLRVDFAARNVFKDAMVAPLFGREGVIGTVLVGDRLGEVSTFDSEDLKLFETLANHATVSLENARLVDRLRDSLAHLTEMNRLKDDFVAAVSHELRTPLTSIQGYVKTLLRPEMRDFDHDQQVSFLEAVDRQSERLRMLIEDLLVVARLDADEIAPMWTPVHIDQVIERVLVELRDRKVSHDLVTELASGLPTIDSDEGKIHQIITNLVDNACKYTPDGTQVEVRCEQEGEGVTVTVADQGEGIPSVEHEKIFDRFYQVDQSSTRKVGGTGLGLYLCRRLAESLGGRIWLEKSDSTGSTFSLWVPKLPPAPKIATAPGPPTSAADLPA